VFDANFASTGFRGYVQPRKRDDVAGQPSFVPTDAANSNGFVEGSPAQYTFFVPHDAYGLIGALGGDATAVARLDAHFTQINAGTDSPFFYIGDEPGFATPWLYPFAGAPHRTQAVVRKVLREAFATTPNGLPGNDDLGALSAWQAWAMLGMYPAVPGAGILVLGSPTFPKATIKLASGASLVIVGNGARADAPFVQAARLEGRAITRSFVSWDEIAAGATLEMDLGAAPNTAWATQTDDRPPNLMGP
jgi:putative alpha-1,2-mannosidase